MRRVGSTGPLREGRFALRRDEVEWEDGARGFYTIVEGPSSAFVVPVFDDGRTVLVRQWRYPWGASSWEVPAGTLADGEDPLEGARRELAEEAGLLAERWTPLGQVRPSAVMVGRQNLFLAQDLSPVDRSPEEYERDMIVRELPFREALDAALEGGIFATASIAALVRAGRALALLWERRPGPDP